MPDTGKLLVGRRTLLVEDEYSIAVGTERWLLEAGAKVLGPVPSVEQAVELIEEETVSLNGAVLDINLGEGETVYPLADRLNELSVPYLFATGDMGIRGDPVHHERPRLAKPVSRAELITAVANLRQSQPRTA